MSAATTADAIQARQRDAILVASARRGDAAAFGALVDGHLERGYRIASALLGASEADTAVVDASLAAWRHLPRLRDGGEFGAWFDSILVGACSMQARTSERGRSPGPTASAAEWEPAVRSAPAGDSAPDGAESEDALTRLDQAFDQMDVTNRAVLVLEAVAHEAETQIAAVVHEPVGVVRVRLREARAILLAALQAQP